MSFNNIKPKFIVGKQNINATFIEEIRKYIKKHKIVKIKFNVTQKEECKKNINFILEHLDVEILKKIGFTVVLCEK